MTYWRSWGVLFRLRIVRRKGWSKGVPYSGVQLTDGTGWRWEIKFSHGKARPVSQIGRAAAIKLAESAIDRALKDGK